MYLWLLKVVVALLIVYSTFILSYILCYIDGDFELIINGCKIKDVSPLILSMDA